MIVLIINQLGICPYEAEGDAPVAVDPNRPVTSQIALKRVELEGRYVHVGRPCCDIQQAKDVSEFLYMVSLNASRRAGGVEGFEALVAKSNYHASMYRVSIRDTTSSRC